jgi:hypothetical protein
VLLAPRPTPILEDQASVFISHRGNVATHFSRLLRHAWITVGLFLFPGHHTGICFSLCLINFRYDVLHMLSALNTSGSAISKLSRPCFVLCTVLIALWDLR